MLVGLKFYTSIIINESKSLSERSGEKKHVNVYPLYLISLFSKGFYVVLFNKMSREKW